jgi:hypothetical protein
MTDFNATYNEGFEGFSLTTVDGEAMTPNANPTRQVVRTESLSPEMLTTKEAIVEAPRPGLSGPHGLCRFQKRQGAVRPLPTQSQIRR